MKRHIPLLDRSILDSPDCIWIVPGAFATICDKIEEVLARRDPDLRQNAGNLYLLTPSGPIRIDARRLQLRASSVADFYDLARDDLVDPPLKYFSALLRKGVWSFPQLEVEPKGERVPTKKPSRGKGRPTGSGSIAADDALVQQALEMMRTGKATTVHDAARQLAQKAGGYGTLESKIDRLRRKIKKAEKTRASQVG